MTMNEMPNESIRLTMPEEDKMAAIDALSEAQKIKRGICPSCAGSLAFQEGCKVCFACGWGGCE